MAESSVVEAWREWVEAGATEELRARRRLIVQLISALRCTYRWQSYENSVPNLLWLGVVPAEATESISQAVEIAKRCGWVPSAVQREMR